MMLSGLPRTGSGKQDNIRVPGKRVDKDSTRVRVQVLGNLQANGNREAAAQVNWRAQIPAMKFIRWK